MNGDRDMKLPTKEERRKIKQANDLMMADLTVIEKADLGANLTFAAHVILIVRNLLRTKPGGDLRTMEASDIVELIKKLK